MLTHKNHKCVIILKRDLAPGFAANASAVLAISIGQKKPEIVAEDLLDGSGQSHAGLVNVPVPVLQADALKLKEIREAAANLPNLTIVDFSEPARVARTYEAYKELLSQTKQEDLEYVGIALLGDKTEVTRFTSGLPLLK